MKLYIYTKGFPPDITLIKSEGTKKAIHGLASGLVKCGIEVIILCEGKSDDSFEMPEGYKIKCFMNPNQNQTFKIANGLKQFISHNLDRHSLIILSGIFQPRIYAISRVLKKYSVPYVVFPHDPYNPAIFSKNSYVKWVYWYLLERRVLRQAKAVQILDIRHAEFLRDLKVNTPVIAAPNGFLPNEVYPEASLNWNTESTPKFFFIGRIDTHNKGLDLLVDAFAQIVETTDAKLIIQGADKGDKKNLEDRVARLSLSNRTLFLPADYSTPTPLIIKNYDVFCVPSRFEGFSLAALEAMLAGRVLLVSEVAGIAPHVQASGCGVVVVPEVSEIQSGLRKLLECRSDWKEMGLRGRHYALEHLDWNKIASTALDQYKRLVESSD
ncbi:glycosyltransferase [Nostoc sp. B(2019)]|nr:glycosyltransferase [Nostoc sp. B(2019)]